MTSYTCVCNSSCFCFAKHVVLWSSKYINAKNRLIQEDLFPYISIKVIVLILLCFI